MPDLVRVLGRFGLGRFADKLDARNQAHLRAVAHDAGEVVAELADTPAGREVVRAVREADALSGGVLGRGVQAVRTLWTQQRGGRAGR